MIRLVFLFFIFAISLLALSDGEILNRADSYMKSGKKTSQFRAYNDYKNLYLRSIMSGDDELKITSLKGIIESGTILHVDVFHYVQELASSQPKESKNSKNSTALNNKSSAQTKPKSEKNDKKEKKIGIIASHRLQSIDFKDDSLVLEFDNDMSSQAIKYFTMFDSKNKQYRYIFDIHNSMLTKSETLRKPGVNRVRLAQFTPDTLRLVIENDKKLAISFKNDSNQFIVDIGGLSIADKGATYSENAEKSEKIEAGIKLEETSAPKRLDKNKVIVIDAGHGGKDPGAIGCEGYQEKNIVFQVAKELKGILKSRGYKVFMTRDSDRFVKLSLRTQYANKKNADIFVSIHANAVAEKNAESATGIECYFLSKSRSGRAKKVAALENSADLSDMNFYGKESFLSTITAIIS
jgi:N-acetylmuramoyl-L-alanine amidase